jgi:KaiC/GvpD/RAD55 family RecA-like ATPase
MGKEPRIRPVGGGGERPQVALKVEPKAQEKGGRAEGAGRSSGRLSTCILGLDERMAGGIPKGFVTLVAGPVGSMKSSLCFAIAQRASNEGAKALYLTLEQDSKSLLAHMEALGLGAEGGQGPKVVDFSGVRDDIAKAAEGGGLHEALGALLERYKKEQGCDVVVLDSLDALLSVAETASPRKDLFHLFRRLKGLGSTVLLISEMEHGASRFGRTGVEEFLSDGIIHLRTRELETPGLTSVRRYVGIVKMRQTAHDTDYHPFLFTKDGFELVLD